MILAHRANVYNANIKKEQVKRPNYIGTNIDRT